MLAVCLGWWTVGFMVVVLFVGLWLGVVAACVASFGCVVGERVPAGRSVNGRSVCACGRELRAWENVPVVGWLRTGGVAKCCGSVLPRKLLWAEVVSFGVGFVVGCLLGVFVLPVSFVLALVAAVVAVCLVGVGVVWFTWEKPS